MSRDVCCKRDLLASLSSAGIEKSRCMRDMQNTACISLSDMWPTCCRFKPRCLHAVNGIPITRIRAGVIPKASKSSRLTPSRISWSCVQCIDMISARSALRVLIGCIGHCVISRQSCNVMLPCCLHAAASDCRVYNCWEVSPVLRRVLNDIRGSFCTSSHEMYGLRLNHPNMLTICGDVSSMIIILETALYTRIT